MAQESSLGGGGSGGSAGNDHFEEQLLADPRSTSFNSSIPSDDDPQAPAPPSRKLLSSFCEKLKKRNNRAAKYPAVLDQFFTGSELGKVIEGLMFAGVFVLLTGFHQPVISEGLKEDLLLVLFLGGIAILNSLALQDKIPEVAAALMIMGVCMGVGSFHAVIYSYFSQNRRRLQLHLFAIFLYALVGLPVFWELCTKGVRADDETRDKGEDEQRANLCW